MNEPEVYPNAPVVLVALEVRHPIADQLTPAETRAIKKHLAKQFPLEVPGQIASLQVNPLGGAADVTNERFPRFLNRRKTVSISMRQEALVLEASEYPGWHDFKEIIGLTLGVRMEVAPVDGIVRVGLRYIDEVRVPGEGDPDWSEWIDPSLLGPRLADVGLPLNQWQGVGIYGSQPGQMLVARYGPRVGFAMDPGSDLRRARPADGGPFFLLDMDSFWTPDQDVPEFDLDTLVPRCDELHNPIRALFESMISDRLRDEVLRNDD
jgi:uncharacterized protein (TIGR04255 family)